MKDDNRDLTAQMVTHAADDMAARKRRRREHNRKQKELQIVIDPMLMKEVRHG
jgi:hypothetical protein